MLKRGSSFDKTNFMATSCLNAQLIKELENIEKQKKFKTQQEKFILLFNKKPSDGLDHLFESNTIENDSYQIAKTFLITQGLNKNVLGKYFGSEKTNNQEVFRCFCELLDFRKLNYDDALRLLLSRFMLPGEGLFFIYFYQIN